MAITYYYYTTLSNARWRRMPRRWKPQDICVCHNDNVHYDYILILLAHHDHTHTGEKHQPVSPVKGAFRPFSEGRQGGGTNGLTCI